jgi:hypothetical protein
MVQEARLSLFGILDINDMGITYMIAICDREDQRVPYDRD